MHLQGTTASSTTAIRYKYHRYGRGRGLMRFGLGMRRCTTNEWTRQGCRRKYEYGRILLLDCRACNAEG